MATNLDQLLEQADRERRAGRWASAQQLYATALARNAGAPRIHHNLALCLYAQGLQREACGHAEAATRLDPGFAVAWILRAKIERALANIDGAEAHLRAALDVDARNAAALLELAGLTLNERGDARLAQALVQPLVGHSDYDEDARLTLLMAKLYDRSETAEELTREIRAFAARYLTMPGYAPPPLPPRASNVRRRIGLLSPLFSMSPVYFFTIGALTHLAAEFDLVFVSRGTRSDWATAKLRTLAHEWHEAAHLPAQALARTIHALDLDVLVDLAGWTDPIALRALSAKPARRMYKWVGGQSCTTGLEVFDGFLSDEHQTPPECARLYSEPLVVLESGYVTYEPPPYMPAPRARGRGRSMFGVISNPVKLSTAFLRDPFAARPGGRPRKGTLRFIDRRYASEAVRVRVLRALEQAGVVAGGGLEVQFRAPKSHQEYLAEVNELDLVLDSFPYTGGLTTMEALCLGRECVTRAGELYSERHTEAHLRFARAPGNPRRDHGRLAQALAHLFR